MSDESKSSDSDSDSHSDSDSDLDSEPTYEILEEDPNGKHAGKFRIHEVYPVGKLFDTVEEAQEALDALLKLHEEIKIEPDMPLLTDEQVATILETAKATHGPSFMNEPCDASNLLGVPPHEADAPPLHIDPLCPGSKITFGISGVNAVQLGFACAVEAMKLGSMAFPLQRVFDEFEFVLPAEFTACFDDDQVKGYLQQAIPAFFRASGIRGRQLTVVAHRPGASVPMIIKVNV